MGRELDDPAIVNLKPLPVPPLNLNLNLNDSKTRGRMKRKEEEGPWEQKPSFNIKQISLVLNGCHLISNNNQTMETETLDPESQLVQAKYFSCKVGVFRKKLDLLFGIFNKSNETLK